MKNQFHTLKVFRKKTCLTQSDVAYLANLKDNSFLSRCESGERLPTIDIILTYQLLFDSELETFFTEYRQYMKKQIAFRINPLIALIAGNLPSEKNRGRIQYLKNTLIRLTASQK